jgi:hypothetical protein
VVNREPSSELLGTPMARRLGRYCASRLTVLRRRKLWGPRGNVNGHASVRAYRNAPFCAGLRLRSSRWIDGARRSGRPGTHHRKSDRCRRQLLRHSGPIRQWRVGKESRPRPAQYQAHQCRRRHKSPAAELRVRPHSRCRGNVAGRQLVAGEPRMCRHLPSAQPDHRRGWRGGAQRSTTGP